MSIIPEPFDTTVKRIYAAWEADNKPRHSRRLGASQIGKSCDRALWYGFRWFALKKFEGRMLRMFEKGKTEETWLELDLKRIGVEIQITDPETREQWEFNDIGNHFVCKLDGAAKGFVEAPETWHACEFKTSNEASYNKIVKEGCLKAKPEHFAQCMVGMGLSGMDRAAYIVVNKNTDEIYLERIPFDKKEFQRIMQRAKEIIFATTAPDRIGTGPAYWECRFCDFAGVCHHGQEPERNCRTCAFSTPLEDGGWACDKKQTVLENMDACGDYGCIS